MHAFIAKSNVQPPQAIETMWSLNSDTSFMSSDTSRVRVFTALHDIAVAIGGVLAPVELARLVVNRARELGLI